MPFFYKPYKKLQPSLQEKIAKIYNIQARAIKKIHCILMQLVVTRIVFCKKRVLRFAPLSALMTVEAAVALPLFLTGVFTLLNVVHMLGTAQSVITAGARSIHRAGVHGYEEGFGTDDVLRGLILELGESDVDFSQIAGGMAGIDYWGTGFNGETGEIDASLSCRLKPVFNPMSVGAVKLSLSFHTRAFIGGKLLCDSGNQDGPDKKRVFVAENGVVYHSSRECAYIDLSLHGVMASSAETQRNAQGGKYYRCELCGTNGETSVLYITHTGNRYHCSSQCPGIRRTVYEMLLTPDCVLPPCSRCGG